MTLRIATLLAALTFTAPAFAGYLAVGESGEILPVGEYQFGVMPQLLLNEGGGADVDAFVDAPLNDASSFRVQAGAGKVDFHLGASLKYVPFPDVDNQPAIGGRVALWYARVKGVNVTTAQLAPLLSRKVDTEHGVFVPYVALPLNFANGGGTSTTGIQLTLGSEWRKPEWPNMLMGAELALNLDKTYSALNAWVAFPFDGERGFKR